jgi:iron complex transport system substrate-binding protein
VRSTGSIPPFAKRTPFGRLTIGVLALRGWIRAAGGIDAGMEAGVVGTVDVTPEALAAAAPDVIVVPADGYDILGGIDGLLAIPGVAATPAGSRRSVLAYPEGDFLTFGPRIADSIALLADDLAQLAVAP